MYFLENVFGAESAVETPVYCGTRHPYRIRQDLQEYARQSRHAAIAKKTFQLIGKTAGESLSERERTLIGIIDQLVEPAIAKDGVYGQEGFSEFFIKLKKSIASIFSKKKELSKDRAKAVDEVLSHLNKVPTPQVAIEFNLKNFYDCGRGIDGFEDIVEIRMKELENWKASFKALRPVIDRLAYICREFADKYPNIYRQADATNQDLKKIVGDLNEVYGSVLSLPIFGVGTGAKGVYEFAPSIVRENTTVVYISEIPKKPSTDFMKDYMKNGRGYKTTEKAISHYPSKEMTTTVSVARLKQLFELNKECLDLAVNDEQLHGRTLWIFKGFGYEVNGAMSRLEDEEDNDKALDQLYVFLNDITNLSCLIYEVLDGDSLGEEANAVFAAVKHLD